MVRFFYIKSLKNPVPDGLCRFNQTKVEGLFTLEVDHHSLGGITMKKYLITPVLALSVGLLAGCNPLSLLGNVDIGKNALPIEGKTVDVTFPAPLTATNLKAQVEGTVNAVKEITSEPFKDIDGSQIPGAIQRVIQEVGIASATLTGPTTNCSTASPPSIKIKVNKLSVSVTDATSNTLSGEASGSFSVTKGATGYTVGDIALGAVTLVNSGTGSVLTSGGDNTLKIKLDASATSDPKLESCTLSVKFSGGTTKVGF
jgi:hypothetical protein